MVEKCTVCDHVAVTTHERDAMGIAIEGAACDLIVVRNA